MWKVCNYYQIKMGMVVGNKTSWTVTHNCSVKWAFRHVCHAFQILYIHYPKQWTPITGNVNRKFNRMFGKQNLNTCCSLQIASLHLATPNCLWHQVATTTPPIFSFHVLVCLKIYYIETVFHVMMNVGNHVSQQQKQPLVCYCFWLNFVADRWFRTQMWRCAFK